MSPCTNQPDASAREIAQYLHSGDSDALRGAWSGSNILERMQTARRELRAALVQEVRRRTHGLDHASVPKVDLVEFASRELDLVEFARRKLEPMVRGLLPRDEQSIALDVLVESVVFVTHDNYGAISPRADASTAHPNEKRTEIP